MNDTSRADEAGATENERTPKHGPRLTRHHEGNNGPRRQAGRQRAAATQRDSFGFVRHLNLSRIRLRLEIAMLHQHT